MGGALWFNGWGSYEQVSCFSLSMLKNAGLQGSTLSDLRMTTVEPCMCNDTPINVVPSYPKY